MGLGPSSPTHRTEPLSAVYLRCVQPSFMVRMPARNIDQSPGHGHELLLAQLAHLVLVQSVENGRQLGDGEVQPMFRANGDQDRSLLRPTLFSFAYLLTHLVVCHQ